MTSQPIHKPASYIYDMTSKCQSALGFAERSFDTGIPLGDNLSHNPAAGV